MAFFSFQPQFPHLYESASNLGSTPLLAEQGPGLTCKAQITYASPPRQIMRAHQVKNLVFSSSATVYGNPQYLPLDEAHPTGGCTNPYGKSKFFIEEMIQDLCRADKVRAPRTP